MADASAGKNARAGKIHLLTIRHRKLLNQRTTNNMKPPLKHKTTNKVSYKHVADFVKKCTNHKKTKLLKYHKTTLTDTFTIQTTHTVTITKLTNNTYQIKHYEN